MALTYRQVKDLYDVLETAGVTQKSLPEWSTEMQALTGSDAYAAGQSDSWIKRASVGIDRAIEKTGASDALAPVGRDFGSLFGNPEAGESVARGIPRFAANLLPMLIPGVGLPATAARLGGMGLLQGADTYTQTDSKAAGILSGLTAAAMPKVANLAEQAVLKGLGGREVAGSFAREWGPELTPNLARGVKAVRELFPTNYGQGIAAQVGGEVAASAFGELSNMAQAGVDPNQEYHFSPSAAFIDMTLGQIPFAALYTTKGGRAALGGDTTRQHADALQKQIDITQSHLQIKKAMDDAKAEPTVPDVARPAWTPEQQLDVQNELARLRGEQARVANDPNLGPDAKAAALAPLVAADVEASAKVAAPQRGNIFGENPDLSGHLGVVGQELPHRQGDKVRRIFIADDPSNPEELRGKVVIYSKGLKEPAPADVAAAPGYQTFGIPADPRWRTTLPDRVPPKDLGPEDALAWTAAQAKLRAKVDQKTNPLEFAEQQKALDLEHWGEQTRLLDEATVELDKAATPAELTAAAAKLRLVQQSNGFPALNDVTLNARMVELSPEIKDPVVAVLKADAAETKAWVEATRRGDARKETKEKVNQDAIAFVADMNTSDPEGPAKQFNSLLLKIQEKIYGDKDAETVEDDSSNLTRALEDLPKEFKKWVESGAQDFPAFEKKFLETKRRSSSIKGRYSLDEKIPGTDGEGLDKHEVVAAGDAIPEVRPLKQIQSREIKEAQQSVEDTAKRLFAKWELLHPNSEGDFSADTDRFHIYFDMMLRNQLKFENGRLDADSVEHLQEWFAARDLGADDPEVLADYPVRPHVMEWSKAAKEMLTENKNLPSPSPSPKIAAGGGFLWDFVPYDAATDSINGKPLCSLGAKGGWLLESRFKNVGGEPTLSNAVLELGRLAVPEAFKDGNVNIPLLFKELPNLSQAFAKYDAQNGFTLTNPSRTLGKKFVPQDAIDQQIQAAIAPEKGGVGLWGWLARQDEPSTRAFAEDTKNYRNLISRMDVELRHMDGEGTAQLMPNGRVLVRLNPALFADPNSARARQVVAHEFIHGLTLAHLDMNPGARKELLAMRDRLVEGLSPKDRALYDKAVKDRWLEKFASGEISTMDGLAPDWKTKNILYGLLDHKELLSQGFSSPEFIQFLRSQKSEGGKTFFHTFVNWVKQTLGFGQQGATAFDELMSRSGALMQGGEYVASFQNYAERYFEGQGLDPARARVQTDRALSLVFEESAGTNPELLFRNLAVRPHVTSQEIQNAEKMLNLLLQDKTSDEYGQLMSGMREHGLKPDRNGLDEFAQMVLRGEETPDAFDVLPPEANAYVWAKVSDMKQVLDVVAAATKEKVSPLVNISEPQNLRGPVSDAVKAAARVLRARAFHEESARELIGLQGIDPMGYVESMAETEGVVSRSPKSEMMGYVEDTKDAAKGVWPWVTRTLQPLAQRMAEMPESAEVFVRGFQLPENARRFVSDTLKPMGRDISDPTNNDVTKKSLAESLKVLQNPRLEAIAQKYIWLNQVEGKKNKSITILPESHPEIQKILLGLSAADKSALHDVIGKLSYSTQATNAKQLEYMKQVAAVRAAIIANADNGLTTAQNVKVTGEMLQSVLDLNDPAKAAVAGQKLAALQSKFTTPEAFVETLKFTEAEAAKYKLWEDLFKANPAYANAQRQGRYLIHYRDKAGKLQLGQTMSKAAGRLWLENHGFKLDHFEANWKDGDDSFPALGTDAEGVLQRYRDYEESQLAILRNWGFTDEQTTKVRQSSPAAALATEAAYRGGISSDVALARNLGKGAEHLPWVENHFTWVQRSANYWTRQLFAAQMDAHILEKQFEDRPDLRQDFKTHKDNMLQRDPEVAQKITRFARTWFMGFNAASALVNMAQPFTTHVAELTALTGKPLDSYRRVLNALGEIAGERGGKDWATPEHKWLHAEMAKDGVLDLSMFDDNAAVQESIHTRYKEVIEGSQPQTLGQKLGKAAGHYSTAAFWMFRQGERINATAATFASYDLFREQGMSRDEAYAKAKEFNARTNYSGGKAQRSLGAFSSRSGFGRGTAMLATSLQSYVLGTTFQLARYLQAGLFRPKGLTPAEVFAARKAAVQMLGTQLAAAGVLGLPFVSGAIALLDKTFPGLEMNRNLRELMGQIFGEDEKNGNTLSDMAMTGLPSMLGWDMQSRLSMGNTVPGVSEINGFQPEMLLGPSANLVTNFIRGGKGLVTGDMGAAAKGLLPGYAKSLIEAGKQTLGQPVGDYRDRPLFTPTPGEVLGQSIGFKPKRLSDANAADRMLRASEDVAQRRDHQQSNQLAERALAGEFGTVRQTLLSRAQTEPQFDPVAGARQVAQAAEALSFPRDLRREGTQRLSAQRSKMLSSFGVKAGDASEVARLQFRWQIEARLGVPPSAGRNSELQQAQLIDQLALKNPGLSRLELRQLALQIRRPNSVAPTLGEPRE